MISGFVEKIQFLAVHTSVLSEIPLLDRGDR